MEINILHNAKFRFPTRQLENEGWMTRSSGCHANICPTIEDGVDNEIYCEYLNTAIMERPWTTKSIYDREINWDMEVAIALPDYDESFVGNQPVGELKIFSSLGDDSFFKVLHECFIENMQKQDKEDNILMNVYANNFGLFPSSKEDCVGPIPWEATGLTLSECTESDRFHFTDNKLVLPEKMVAIWKKDVEFRGNFTISLVLSDSALSMLYNINISPEARFSHLKKSLDEETCTDTEILVGFEPKQVAIKCHLLMLVSGSVMFKNMLENEMKESNEHKIKIPEMSESGARAMLAFLYYRGMKDVYANAEVAVEVLQAAVKYGIEVLKDEIHCIILAKPNSWFTVDVALELLIFAEKINAKFDVKIENEGVKEQETKKQDSEDPDSDTKMFCANFKRKSLHVLRWYAKWKPNEIMKSQKYQEIFKENPKLGMEVSLCFLQI